METETKPRAILPRLKIFLIKALCLLALAPFAASLINGGLARCYERYENIRASIVERFREVQVVREYLPRETKPIAVIVKDAAKRHGISSLLLTALITQESGEQLRTDRMRFEPHLQGRFKCQGWMNETECRAQSTSFGLGQVIPGFWGKFCGLQSWSDLLDPEINLNCSASILADCLQKKANIRDKMDRYRECLQAYNGSSAYPPQVFQHLTRIIVEQQL